MVWKLGCHLVIHHPEFFILNIVAEIGHCSVLRNKWITEPSILLDYICIHTLVFFKDILLRGHFLFKSSQFESGSEDGVSGLTNSKRHIIFNPLFKTTNLCCKIYGSICSL